VKKKEELKGADLYLFGSALHSNNISDLDLLIIYDSDVINAEIAIGIRKVIREKLQRKLDLIIDITLLSIAEQEQTKFIKSEKAIRVM
jgi:predicted nucleotidyltransferase